MTATIGDRIPGAIERIGRFLGSEGVGKLNRELFEDLMALYISASESQKLAAEIKRLGAIVDYLPRCWRLTDGRLVQDCPVVPGMELFYASHERNGDEWKREILSFRVTSLSEVVGSWDSLGTYGTLHIEQCCNTREAVQRQREGI